MESKDWIILLVPIVLNGIILYTIQSYFQSKLKRSEHKDEIKRKINAELFSLLLDAKNNYRALYHCCIDDPQNIELFNLNLKKFNLSIRKILDYYDNYSFYLNRYSSNIAQLRSVYDKYVAFGSSLSSLNDVSRKQFQDYLGKLFELICNAAELYVKDI